MMRIERWYWFLSFCLLSLCIHAGLAFNSRRFVMPILTHPHTDTLEVTLEPLPSPPPMPAPKPEPKPEANPRPKTDFGVHQAVPPKHADADLLAHSKPDPEPALEDNATPVPESTVHLEPAPEPAPTNPGGEDPLKAEKPLPIGTADGAKVSTAPKITYTLRINAGLAAASKNKGGGSPAPNQTFTGKGGAPGPEAPPEDVVYAGGGAGGQNLPKAPAKIGGGGGNSILSVDNPLAKEAIPEDKPGLGPGTGGGAGTGGGGGVGFVRGKGIGTRRNGVDGLASLNSKPGNGIGAGEGSGIGTKAPGGGKGTGSELPGTGGEEGASYGNGKGIGIGNGMGLAKGRGNGSGLGGNAFAGNNARPFGDLSGLLRGDANGGGGAGGGPGGSGKGNGGGFGTTTQTPFALKGDIYLLEPNTQKLPDFSKLTSIGSVYTTELNIPTRHWDKGFPGVTDRFEWFALDYNGTFTLKKATNLHFKLSSDDGSKLFIDDQLVIDNDGLHSTQMKEGAASLLRGQHKLRVQYFQGPKDEIAPHAGSERTVTATDASLNSYGPTLRHDEVRTTLASGADNDAGTQILALLKQHSLWITQECERRVVRGQPTGIALIKKFAEEKQIQERIALKVITTYTFLRHLHFARRQKLKIAPALFLDMIVDWTPPGWVYNGFPSPEPDVEVVSLGYIVDALQDQADRCTKYDSLPLGPAMHVCHMLVALQGMDGLWATQLNLRTGKDVGQERTDTPRSLMRRLNKMLGSCEYDFALRRAEEGIRALQAK